MKTFETEKHNIPEGATHYWDETLEDFFAWWDGANKLMLTPDGNGVWESVYDKSGNEPTPIPQTNIETPEEKEVEWVNGDDVEAYGKLYKYVGLDPFNDNLCICLANQDDDPQCFSIEVLNKPETEAERVERERLEAAYDLYCEFTNSSQEDATCMSMYGFKMSQVQRKWLAIVDKTNYRKESE